MKYLLITCLLLSSCVTYKKAANYLNDTEQGAMYCAANFPVKDSIAPVQIVISPANNKDYQKNIDSLNWSIFMLKGLNEEILKDTGRCCEVVRSYAPVIDSLSNMAVRFKYIYLPCVPDTIEIKTTVYRRDTAKEMESSARALASQREADFWQKVALVLAGFSVIFVIIIIIKR